VRQQTNVNNRTCLEGLGVVSLQTVVFPHGGFPGPCENVCISPCSNIPPSAWYWSTSLIQERQDSDLGHVAFIAGETASHGLVKTIPPKFSAAGPESFQKHREDGCSLAGPIALNCSGIASATCQGSITKYTMHRQRLSPRSSLGHSSRTDTPKRGSAARVSRHAGGTLRHSKACWHIGFHGRDENLRRTW
jgi:hypothetical protein